MSENHELNLAYKFVNNTNRNIYLTGKAGTGKTTFLHNLKKNSYKRTIVIAPTGVAAINAGGVTIHSFFQLPFGPILTEQATGHKMAVQKFTKNKINIIKSIDLLIIDEISMVRADILDGIDDILRRFRNRELPFGGVQLLMIGDLQQLAPVVKKEDKELLSPYYENLFFFNSKALKASSPVYIELKHIYRQNDERFIKILNEIRENSLSETSRNELNKRHIPDFKPDEEGYITLTTHNSKAENINNRELEEICGEKKHFKASVTGIFPEYSYPTEFDLFLKEGAQVIFVKNDSKPEKRYYNGKIGIITSVDDKYVIVKCKEDTNAIYVEKEEWCNCKYIINNKTNEIEEEVIGRFVQFPLRLAWAITIHKSQGLTFEKAIIDAHYSFAHGQTYVALSRCKSLDGVVLSSSITSDSIISDYRVVSFNNEVKRNQPDNESLNDSQKAYQTYLINEMFDYSNLSANIKKCIRELQYNDSNIQGNLLDILNDIIDNTVNELNSISSKFRVQINYLMNENPDIESNTKLQERITKACNYYFEKTQNEICKKLNDAVFSTDNNSVKKTIKESLKQLNESLNIKSCCLNASAKGFNITEHLRVRANAIIQNSVSKTGKEISNIDKMSDNPELFKRLSLWRKETAAREEIPPYRIASQSVLLQISNNLPLNLNELESVKGIGPKKIKTYGAAFIKIIETYCKEKEIQPDKRQQILLM